MTFDPKGMTVKAATELLPPCLTRTFPPSTTLSSTGRGESLFLMRSHLLEMTSERREDQPRVSLRFELGVRHERDEPSHEPA